MRASHGRVAVTVLIGCLATGACTASRSGEEGPGLRPDDGTTGSQSPSGSTAPPSSPPCPGPDRRPVGKIAYSHLDQDGDWSIWIMNPDGTGRECLLDTPAPDEAPAWSPDGRRLVFSAGDDLYVADSDGNRLTMLQSGGRGSVSSPEWSPGGDSIVFTRTPAGVEEPDILTIDASGGRAKTLIRSGERFFYVDEPHWSPDGETVLFLAARGGWSDLYGIDPDGSKVGLLLRRGFDLDGSGLAWSPDGDRIVFQADLGGGCLFVVDTRTRRVRRLVPECSVGVDLTWSPDGSRIIWGPSDNGPGDLYSVSSRGGQVDVVEDSAVAASPAWQPS
jgi:Tol biopolymer transport system component